MLRSGNGKEDKAEAFGGGRLLGGGGEIGGDGAVPIDVGMTEDMVLIDEERVVFLDEDVAGDAGVAVTVPASGRYGMGEGPVPFDGVRTAGRVDDVDRKVGPDASVPVPDGNAPMEGGARAVDRADIAYYDSVKLGPGRP